MNAVFSTAAALLALLAAALCAGGPAPRPPLDDANKLCPVMTEEEVKPDKFTVYQGKKVYFCCDRCKAKFEADPEKYLANLPQFGGNEPGADDSPSGSAPAPATDPAGAHPSAPAATPLTPDQVALAALLFAPDNERAMIARRQLRLQLVPKPPAPPSTEAPAFNEIDRFIAAKWRDAGLPAATEPPPVCDDATFLRRVSLDLTGLIPTSDTLCAFLASTDSDKRAKLVDDLLARSDDYAAHWTPFWEDALGSTDVNNQGGVPNRGSYRDWIFKSFKSNKPFDVFAAELIDPTMPGRKPPETADANGKVTRTQYVLNYDHVSTLQTAASVAQVFMGTGMKCASCHSHFENPEWPQKRFLAFAGLFSGHDLEVIRCEKKMGEFVPAAFCFDLPGVPNDVPTTEDGRLRRAAQLLTDPTNPRFARAIVNRLWKRYLGLGLFEPVDDFRLDRPPSHPELLDWLAYDFMAHGYDLKHTIRLILTSRTYQLHYDPALEDHFDVSKPKEPRYFRSPSLRRLTAEQFVDSLRLATEGRLDPKQRLYRSNTSTALTRSLGKPASRNEISTGRPDDVAVVQSLELLNGEELAGAAYGASFLSDLSRRWGTDPAGAIDALYLSILSRAPTAAERDLVLSYIRAASDSAGPASARETESILIDDDVPAGAETSGEWTWLLPDQAPVFSGARSHTQKSDGKQAQHYALGLKEAAAGPRDTLFVYVYLDPADPPREIMVQWNDGVPVSDGGWAHRAYWGENMIGYGADNTASRRRIGDLPAPGAWARLEVPAAAVGFSGGAAHIVGMSFDQLGGTVYWDKAGITQRGGDPIATALGDVLWSLVTGPEFQYVR
jgi:hypothetical protein